MGLSDISERGLVLLGCGKMGTALLEGWLARGLPPEAVTVLEPKPGARLEELAERGLHLNTDLPARPAVAVLAVKPQMMGDALPWLTALGNGETVFVSIAASPPRSTRRPCRRSRAPPAAARRRPSSAASPPAPPPPDRAAARH